MTGNKLQQFVKDEDGLTTVEYIIILILIAVLGIVAWRQFGASVVTQVNSANTDIAGLRGGGGGGA